MASTLKQRLRRFNGTDYDTIYMSPNVGDAIGTLPVANGGTGRSTLTSGYFLRGNGTGVITMDSVATVKTALGISDIAHVAIAKMTETRSGSDSTYTLSNLGFVVKAFYGRYIDTSANPDRDYEVIYPVSRYNISTASIRYSSTGSDTVYLSVNTNTTTSFIIKTSSVRPPVLTKQLVFIG